MSGGTGGIARVLKRKAVEAQNGGGEDDADNDNMLGGSNDGDGDGGRRAEEEEEVEVKGSEQAGRQSAQRPRCREEDTLR